MKLYIMVWYELKRVFRSWITLSIAFISPLLLVSILGFAMSGPLEVKDEQIKEAEVVVYTEDHGIMNAAFRTYLDHEHQASRAAPVYASTMDAFQDRIAQGEAHVGVFIPESFSRSVLAGEEAHLTLYSGTGIAKNISAQAVIQRFLDAYNHARAEKETLRKMLDPTSISQVLSQLTKVEDHVKMDRQSQFSPRRYYSVHMLIMFLSYSGLLFAINYLFDRQNHTLARMFTSPVKPSNIILGKVIAYSLLAILQAFVIFLFSSLVFQIDWGRGIGWLILVALLVIMASMSLALLLMKSIGTIGGVAAAFNVVVLVSTFVSGGVMPIDGGMLDRVAACTINYWATLSLLGAMLDSSLSTIIQYIGKLIGIACLLLIAASLTPDLSKGGEAR